MVRTGLQPTGLLVVLVAVILQPAPRTWLVNLGTPSSELMAKRPHVLMPQGKGKGPVKKELVITTPSLPTVIAGYEYSVQLEATGGKKPYTWAVIEGTLPSELSLTSDGLLFGMVPISGSSRSGSGVVEKYSFTIEVTDSSGKKARGKSQQ